MNRDNPKVDRLYNILENITLRLNMLKDVAGGYYQFILYEFVKKFPEMQEIMLNVEDEGCFTMDNVWKMIDHLEVADSELTDFQSMANELNAANEKAKKIPFVGVSIDILAEFSYIKDLIIDFWMTSS